MRFTANEVPDAVVIRDAGVADAELLAAVGSSSFRDAYGAHSEASDLEAHLQKYFSGQAIQAEMKSGQSSYLLAIVNDTPCGLAKYRKAACPVPGGDDNAIEIQQLYVLAHHKVTASGEN